MSLSHKITKKFPKAVKPAESMASKFTFEVQRELTASGMTAAELRVLDRLYTMLPEKGIVGLTGSYLARSLGISSQAANGYLRKFHELKLIIRFRRGVMQTLDTGLKRISSKIRRIRRAVKSLFLKRIKRSLKPLVSQSHKDKRNNKGNLYFSSNPSRENGASALEVEQHWLREMGLAS